MFSFFALRGLARGFPWLQTLNGNFLLILSLLERYLAVYLFLVNILVPFTGTREDSVWLQSR